jgi:nucleotide-binding universal stress UspA family protein
MRTSIVCGVDGSPDSRAALQVAARLAKQLNLRLIAAHVAEPAYLPYAVAERLLDQVVVTAGLDAERRTAVGVPAERLAEIADEVDAELIVVGSRGRGAFKAAFLGSVSNALVGVARCPVLIVPPGATDAA